MSENIIEPTLTGDDLALAAFGVGHMIAWWKKRPPSQYRNRQIWRAEILLQKLDAIGQVAYPYPDVDLMPDECGIEPIMRVDPAQIERTRNEAARRLSGHRGAAS